MLLGVTSTSHASSFFISLFYSNFH